MAGDTGGASPPNAARSAALTTAAADEEESRPLLRHQAQVGLVPAGCGKGMVVVLVAVS